MQHLKALKASRGNFALVKAIDRQMYTGSRNDLDYATGTPLAPQVWVGYCFMDKGKWIWLYAFIL